MLCAVARWETDSDWKCLLLNLTPLPEIKKVAVMLKKHLSGVLSYFRHRVTNATNEGFNSRIQAIKSTRS